MTKEELEKEAIKCMHEIKYWIRVPIKKETEKDGISEILKLTEPREKRIADLERKLEQTEKDLTDYQFNYPKIKDLEKENAELKAQLQKKINTTTVSDYPYSALKLEEAKELLKRYVDFPTSNDEVWELHKEAEQFLKEIEK